MFVFSVRSGTVKLFGLVALTLLLLAGALIFGTGDTVLASSDGGVSFEGVKTEEDRIAFIESFGIKVDKESGEAKSFSMPENFDRVIVGYNELQKKQGLDLSKYQGKKVTRYTYKVENYDCDGEVYASLFIYRSRVIACDVSSADPEGFVIPLTLIDQAKLK